MYRKDIRMFQCKFHNEPFTMFCTTKKTMLCIKCFRDTSMDARLHCVDLDTAYNQGAKKLERALVVRLSNSLCSCSVQHYIKEINPITVNQRAAEFPARWSHFVPSFARGVEAEHGQ